MQMAGTDKVTRILMLYTRLMAGGKIHKVSFCIETEIDRRTFDRDIEDIRLFLSESFSGKELVYDRNKESYYLERSYQQKALSGMEITMLLESIRAGNCLREDEYGGLIDSLVKAGEISKQKVIQEIAQRYIRKYSTEKKKDAIMKMQWDLQQCIAERDMIKLRFINNERKIVSPLELRLYEEKFYLFVYDAKEQFHIYFVENIREFQILGNKFSTELLNDYEKIDEKEKQKKLQKERKENGRKKEN